MSKHQVLAVILLQLFCAVFLLWDILSSVFSLPVAPLNWQIYELVQLATAAGLVIGVVMGAVMIRDARRRTEKAETALRAASGAFMDVLEEHFTAWGLTPAERDVAQFAIKGLSTQEIAALRNTSEGTVKAQTNAIYRKAGVSGRPQLLSIFIDALMEFGS